MDYVEFDQDRYPFGELRVGKNWFLTNIATLERVCDKPLPLPVLQPVARKLNDLYYRKQTDALEHTLQNPLALIVDEAAAAKTLGVIGAGEYRALLNSLGA